LTLPVLASGQRFNYYNFPSKHQHDRLELAYKSFTTDTQRLAACHDFAFYFSVSKRDSALYYTKQQLALSKKFGFKLWEADALDGYAFILWRIGNYPEALQSFLAGIKIADDPATEKNIWHLQTFTADKNPKTARLIEFAQLEFDLSTLYEEAGYSDKERLELIKAEKIAKQNNDKSALAQIYYGLGSYYLTKNMADTAITYLQKSLVYVWKSGYKQFEGECLNDLGNAWLIKGNYATAKINISRSIRENTQQNFTAALTHSFLSLADLFIKQNNNDSSIYYAKKAWVLTKITNDLSDAVIADNTLSTVFKLRKNIDSAYKYQSLALSAKDSLNNADRAKQFQNIGFTEQLRVQQLEEEKIAVQNKVRTYAMLAGLSVVLLIAFILWRNNRHKQKANAVLAKTLSDLKSTQTQLIQSEKMASLGELTAGIAHEIQNPLNFVNNFSEVNTEMLHELEDELKNGNADEALALAADIIKNEEKINHHGKRADFIVKGMLEHSRTGTGEKQPTDLNVLCDEFMKLSYHGLRAKDKNFNAEMITHFDEELPKANVSQQDMGRVMLNVFNNAFYAVNQKQKTAGPDYKPEVSVTTLSENGTVVIRVKDNGNGIPDAIKDKIMQPFFTTKPTGEGTGLGLSLSYDIVVKGHGGNIAIESIENGGSEFTISIPI
jgi:two-component system NtrC family sensor kinase